MSKENSYQEIVNLIEKNKEKLSTGLEGLKAKIKSDFDSNNLNFEGQMELSQTDFEENLAQLNDKVIAKIDSLITSQETDNNEYTKKLNEFIIEHKNSSITQINKESKIILDGINSQAHQLKDSSSAYSQSIGEIKNKLVKTTNEITKTPVNLLSKANDEFQKQLRSNAELNRDSLTKNVDTLKSNFSEKLNKDVEKVYQGVVRTKNLVESTIIDTVSQIKQNLNRLNDEIDSHFTSEVGELQGTVHNFEAELRTTIIDSISIYEKEAKDWMDNHSKMTNQQIDELKNKVENIESSINSELTTIHTSADTSFNQNIGEMQDKLNAMKEDFKNSLSQFESNLNEKSNAIMGQYKEGIETFSKKSKSLSSEIKEDLTNLNAEGLNEYKRIKNRAIDKIKNESTDNNSLTIQILQDTKNLLVDFDLSSIKSAENQGDEL